MNDGMAGVIVRLGRTSFPLPPSTMRASQPVKECQSFLGKDSPKTPADVLTGACFQRPISLNRNGPGTGSFDQNGIFFPSQELVHRNANPASHPGSGRRNQIFGTVPLHQYLGRLAHILATAGSVRLAKV
jgi:hypothetical protein